MSNGLKCLNGHNLRIRDERRRITKPCCETAYNLIERARATAPAILRHEKTTRQRREKRRRDEQGS